MITGDVADSVAMIPVCDPCSAYRNSVIPRSSPISAVAAGQPQHLPDTSAGRAGAQGSPASTPIASPEAPTRISDPT